MESRPWCRPTKFLTRTGDELDLLALGPKILKAHLAKEWDHLQAERLAKTEGLAAGERLDVHHVRNLLTPGGRLSYREQGTATNFVTGGLWDVPRLLLAGYQVPDQACALCGHKCDSLDHRAFHCQATQAKDLRKQVLHPSVWEWLEGRSSAIQARATPTERTREDEARKLARKGLARDPTVGQPLPPTKGSQFDGYIDAEVMRDTCGGLVFTDGSCTRPFHPALARASWSTAYVDADGEEVGVSYGPVWRGLPQTAACGEAVAAGAMVQQLRPDFPPSGPSSTTKLS